MVWLGSQRRKDIVSVYGQSYDYIHNPGGQTIREGKTESKRIVHASIG